MKYVFPLFIKISQEQISPFLIFWIGVIEAPLVATVRPTPDVGILGEDSMVGVPLGE